MVEKAQEPPPDWRSEELSDDDLAETAIRLEERGREMIRLAGLARFDLEKRMVDRGATKVAGKRWNVELKSTGYDHTIDDLERFQERLGPLLSMKDQDRAFPLPPPMPRVRGVDTRTLNELHKLGGKVAEIIDEERRSTPKQAKLKITPVSEEETDNGASY